MLPWSDDGNDVFQGLQRVFQKPAWLGGLLSGAFRLSENMGDPRLIAGLGCMENPKIKWMITRGTMGYPYVRKLPDVDAIWCNANIHRLRYIDLREWQRQKPAVFLHVCWIYLCWRCWRPRNATNLGTSRTFNLEIPLGRSGLNGTEERVGPTYFGHLKCFVWFVIIGDHGEA